MTLSGCVCGDGCGGHIIWLKSALSRFKRHSIYLASSRIKVLNYWQSGPRWSRFLSAFRGLFETKQHNCQHNKKNDIELSYKCPI